MLRGVWHRIFFWGMLVVLLLPLLNIPPWFSPPAWGQTIAFRLLLIPLLLLLLWHLAQTRTLSLLIPHGPAKLPWALLYALGGIVLLATLFSQDPARSFWDSPNRAWGTINYLLYIAFAVSAFLALKTQAWKKAWFVLLGTGAALSLLALLQTFGAFSGVLVSYGRPTATVGNTLFLAMALTPLFIMGAVWFLQERRGWTRIALGSMLLVFLFAILATLSRSAFLGLGVGVLVFVLLAFKKSRMVKAGMLGLILAAAFLVWSANVSPTVPTILKPLPTSETLWRRLSLEGALQDPRFSIWRISGQAALEKPLLGYGPSNASLPLDRFYDSSILSLRSAIGWWDSSHNIFLDVLLETGLTGLAVLLALLGALFWKLQELKKKKRALRLHISGVQAAFVGYFVTGFFIFNTFATYLVFFFLVAYSLHLISLPSTPPSISSRRPLPASIGRLSMVAFAGLAAAWLLWQHTLAPLWVTKEMNIAVFQAQQGQCQQALQRAEKLSSPSPQLNYYLPAQYTNVIRACLPSGQQDAQGRVLLSLKAAQLLDEAAAARPEHSKPYLTKVDYLNIAASYLQESKQKEALTRQADAALQKAHELTPKRAELYKKWARTERLRGNYKEAVEKASQCLQLNGTILDCVWERLLANVYRGKAQAADADFAKLEEVPYLPLSRLEELALAYQQIEDYERLPIPYEHLTGRTRSAVYAGALARAHQKAQNWDKAHQASLLVLQWEHKLEGQVKEFLSQIRTNLSKECGSSPSSCWRLSLVELTLGNQAEAARARAKAEQLGFATSSEQALKNLIDVYKAQQDTPNLVATYEKFAQAAERPEQAYYQLAQLYFQEKDYDKTRQALQEVIKIGRENVEHAKEMLEKLPQ